MTAARAKAVRERRRKAAGMTARNGSLQRMVSVTSHRNLPGKAVGIRIELALDGRSKAIETSFVRERDVNDHDDLDGSI